MYHHDYDNIQMIEQLRPLMTLNANLNGDSILFFAKKHFPTQNLLSDAEVLEYVAKDLVSGDIAGNGREVVDALADVLTQEIARYAV